jgi:hypothetical protein
MELTIVVFGIKVALHLLGDSLVVLHVSVVADVQVKVILEVLEHVHIIVYEVISSDSWE